MGSAELVMAVIRGARPTLRNPHDKVAFAVHACFFSCGYLLTATGLYALTDAALSSTSTVEVGIERWNEFDIVYAFVYAARGSRKVLVKCNAVNEKKMVVAFSSDKDSDQTIRLVINVEDYVVENEGANYSDQFKNLDMLLKTLNEEIFVKFDGHLHS